MLSAPPIKEPRLSLIRTLALPLVAIATLAAPGAFAACKDCGVVAEVRKIKKDAANDASTAAAVDAGANYEVVVKMDSGRKRRFTFIKPPEYRPGDKVKVLNGTQLTKQ
jgi:hypothetical protein